MSYSDQPPIPANNTEGDHTSFAHAKGVLAFSSGGGFWLDHSSPSWPQPVNATNASFPIWTLSAGQACLAQQFACFNFDNGASLTTAIPEILYTIKPYIFDQTLPAPLAQQYPALANVSQGQYTYANATTAVNAITVGGKRLQLFCKPQCTWSMCTNELIHDGAVVPGLNMSIAWMGFTSCYNLTQGCGGSAPLNSSCPAEPTAQNPALDSLNVEAVSFPDVGNLTWSSYNFTSDHAKWGVSVGTDAGVTGRVGRPRKKVVCLGDNNRVESQMYRGGAFICMESGTLWHAFADSITSIETCSQPMPLAQTDFGNCPNSAPASAA